MENLSVVKEYVQIERGVFEELVAKLRSVDGMQEVVSLALSKAEDFGNGLERATVEGLNEICWKIQEQLGPARVAAEKILEENATKEA